jgi:hypothetical protein
MATLHQICAYLESLVESVIPKQIPVKLAGGGVNIMSTKVAIGWPPINVLQDAARGNQGIVAVYDRRIARNSTRWNPVEVGRVVKPSTLQSSISNATILPLGSQTITLAGAVAPNDAVSAVLTNRGATFTASVAGTFGTPAAAQVVTGGTGDTAATMATKLAAAINADQTLSTWVTAAAVGAVVTLTSILPGAALTLFSATGNTASRTQEIGRRLRQFQIACWAVPDEARSALTDPIEPLIAQLSLSPPALPDGTFPRISYVNDHDIEDAAMEDLLRRDFFISADYAITAGDVLSSVLAPIPAFQVQQQAY